MHSKLCYRRLWMFLWSGEIVTTDAAGRVQLRASGRPPVVTKLSRYCLTGWITGHRSLLATLSRIRPTSPIIVKATGILNQYIGVDKRITLIWILFTYFTRGLFDDTIKGSHNVESKHNMLPITVAVWTKAWNKTFGVKTLGNWVRISTWGINFYVSFKFVLCCVDSSLATDSYQKSVRFIDSD
jgi:hypothetical protein